MSEPFLSEIRIMSFGFAPRAWAQCNGQLLPINQNQALFSLLGTTYGGNGQTNFALPNFQGRTPVHVGAGIVLGQTGGEQAHTLTIGEMPAHTHVASATSDKGSGTPQLPVGNLFATTKLPLYHQADSNLTPLAISTIAAVGGSQAHENMQPLLALNFCIALQGIYP